MEKPLAKEREFSNGEKKPLEKYYKPVGNSILFNERYLQEKQEEYIFICEGLFDSLSVEEMDFKSIALLTTNQARFYKLLEKLNPKNKTFILLLDNDEAGTTGEEKIAKFLAKNNYNFIKHSDYEKTQTKWKDSNDFLVKNKEEFKEYLKYLQKEAQKMKESKDITNESMMKKIDTFFSKAEAKFFEPIATGFSKIDEITNGGILTQSLLTLGGGTSTGKTTFSLNLALNIAEKRPVIYYTLEMAEEMIEAKLFSHIAYKGKGIKVASDKFLKCYDENKMTAYQKEKIKEELAKPFEVGKTIRVKGKYLKFNTSQDPDWQNVLTIKEVKEEDGKTVIYAENSEYRSYSKSIERVVVEDMEVKKNIYGIGVNPIPAEQWDAHVRSTGFNIESVINRLLNDIPGERFKQKYTINGIGIVMFSIIFHRKQNYITYSYCPECGHKNLSSWHVW
jgi:5S rRNA maturation endonuclease (ribonuclease M5)